MTVRETAEAHSRSHTQGLSPRKLSHETRPVASRRPSPQLKGAQQTASRRRTTRLPSWGVAPGKRAGGSKLRPHTRAAFSGGDQASTAKARGQPGARGSRLVTPGPYTPARGLNMKNERVTRSRGPRKPRLGSEAVTLTLGAGRHLPTAKGTGDPGTPHSAAPQKCTAGITVRMRE